MAKGIKLVIASLVFVVLLAWITGPALLSSAPAGSEANPLISLDYLETVVAALRGEISAKIDDLKQQVANLESRLDQLGNGGTQPPAPDPGPGPLTVLVDASAVNFRPQPNTTSTPITLVYRGDPIRVSKVLGDWYYGQLADGRQGWIFASLTKPQAGHTLGRVRLSSVNVRTGPGTQYSPLPERLDVNDLVNIVGTQQDWYRVILPDGRQGWLHAPLVEKLN